MSSLSWEWMTSWMHLHDIIGVKRKSTLLEYFKDLHWIMGQNMYFLREMTVFVKSTLRKTAVLSVMFCLPKGLTLKRESIRL